MLIFIHIYLSCWQGSENQHQIIWSLNSFAVEMHAILSLSEMNIIANGGEIICILACECEWLEKSDFECCPFVFAFFTLLVHREMKMNCLNLRATVFEFLAVPIYECNLRCYGRNEYELHVDVLRVRWTNGNKCTYVVRCIAADHKFPPQQIHIYWSECADERQRLSQM